MASGNKSNKKQQPKSDSQLDYRVLVGLWIVSLAIYAPFIGKWCLSGDEYYTWDDSFNYSIPEMLGFNSRPLYFIVCHFLLRWLPEWSPELVIRIPAMLAASLTAPTLYGMLSRRRFGHIGFLAALIAMFNPWVFQMSQFGRYFSFVILFGTIATLSALRWLEEQNLKRWPILLFVSGILAAVSHPPSVLVIPGGILAWIVARFRSDPTAITNWLRKFGPYLVGVGVVGGLVGAYLLRDVFAQWSSAQLGAFGDAGIPQIILGICAVSGLSWWALAILPMLRFPTSWTIQDIFLLTMLVGSVTPLLLVVPFGGGGVSARYFLYCLPCMFILAAQHWRQIDERLPNFGYRVAFGCAMFAVNVPFLMSIAKDGNHFDHRAVARSIEEMNLGDPIIYCSGRLLLGHYLDEKFEIPKEDEYDLQLFEQGVPRDQIQQGIDQALSEGRPLLLVARQDRMIMSAEDQEWLYERFAVVRVVETARYDHRRYRVVVYEYRPRTESPTTAQYTKKTPEHHHVTGLELGLTR